MISHGHKKKENFTHSTYYCPECGKYYTLEGTEYTIESFCEETGKIAIMIRTTKKFRYEKES